MPGRSAPGPLPRYSLRPAFALAAIVLLAATGVISGLLVGPPTATMVYIPAAPAPSVAATRDEAPVHSDATPIPQSGRILAEAPSTGGAAPRPPARVADTTVAVGGPVFDPAPPLIRVSRAAARRPRIVSPRPAAFVIPVSTDDARESMADAPAPAETRADEPWTTSLLRVAPQAP